MTAAIQKIGLRGIQRYTLMLTSLVLGLIACQLVG